MEKYSIQRRVYYYETDRMGRVYHSNFVNWMEEARTEYIRKSGTSYKTMEESGVFLPISEISVKYLAPVEYDELVNIDIYISEVSRVKIKFQYEFWNNSKTVKFAEGVSINVFADHNGKLKRVDDEFIKKIDMNVIMTKVHK